MNSPRINRNIYRKFINKRLNIKNLHINNHIFHRNKDFSEDSHLSQYVISEKSTSHLLGKIHRPTLSDPTKTLSLIVPCYNCAQYVHTLINKIPYELLADDIEVIMVDDGSTDNTWEILQKLQNNYKPGFIRAYHKTNGNWGSVINFSKTLDIRGRFVKTVDSDDYLDPSSLLKFIAFLKTLDDEINLVFSNMNFINSKNDVTSQKFYNRLFRYPLFNLDNIRITKMSLLTVHAFCEKRELYLSIPDLPTKMSYMDSVFIFYLLYYSNNYCAFFMGPPLYQYRTGNEDQSVSIQNLRNHTDWIKTMLETEVLFAKNHHIFENSNDAKNRMLGEIIQLGFFFYSYAISYKEDIPLGERDEMLTNELEWIQNQLGDDYKWFASPSIKIIQSTKCRFFLSFVGLASFILNSGFIKATKKDGDRLQLQWGKYPQIRAQIAKFIH